MYSVDINKKVAFPILFALVAGIGLFYVKWNPYYAKIFIAAANHSIGPSIITGMDTVPPAPSWDAALGYAVSYFSSVWKAVILGLLLGSLVQVLIPRKWVTGFMGKADAASTIRSTLLALPGMMCTCCTAPVTAGLRARSASVRASIAFFLANPVLNPATIIFMGFVLSWQFALLRIVLGVALVFLTAYIAGRVAGSEGIAADEKAWEEAQIEEKMSFFKRWGKALWKLIVDTIPAYLIVVFVLGFSRAWLFPSVDSVWGNSLFLVIGFAFAGTLFVIPTAAEIPIVQSLLAIGLASGPATALLITLPAVSLPSLLIVKNAFPLRVLLAVFFVVVAVGIMGGIISPVFLG